MHVYVIGRDDGLIKIGKATSPDRRVQSLRLAGGFAISECWYSVPLINAAQTELSAHNEFAEHRSVGEWYRCEASSVIKHISMVGIPSTDRLDWISKIRDAAKAKGLSYADIGRVMGVNRSAVGHWMVSRNEPTVSQFIALCNAVGVDPSNVLKSDSKTKLHH